MIKTYLMTPGPTPVPERIALSMAQPIMHHRTKEFKSLFYETIELTKQLFQTKNDIAIFSSSGTGAMEASITNLLSEGDEAIAVSSGKFGERWTELMKAYNIVPVVIDVEYGERVYCRQIKEAMAKHPNVKALFIQATETSTGVYHPINKIGPMLKDMYPDVAFVVDGITTIGAMDVKTDEWNIDIMITGSQKALMLPPGLSILSVSEKAKKMMKQSNISKYYFNILGELNADAGHFTPPVTLVLGLRESLKMIFEEGLENVFARHALLAKAARAGVESLGLDVFAKSPTNSLTAVKAPDGVDSADIINLMKTYGVHISNGQGSLKGKIFRIAHLGYFDKMDVVMAISALEMALRKLGINASFGKGIEKVMETFVE